MLCRANTVHSPEALCIRSGIAAQLPASSWTATGSVIILNTQWKNALKQRVIAVTDIAGVPVLQSTSPDGSKLLLAYGSPQANTAAAIVPS